MFVFCYPQVPDISNSKFIKLEVSASSSEKTFVLDINLYFHKFGIADPIDRKDEFCYATCDEVMELVDVDMPINDLKEGEGVKLDAAGTIVDGGPSRTSTDNI